MLADLPPALSPAPVAVHAPAAVAPPLSDERGWRSYRVRPGDTLYDLAREHGTTVAALAEHNDVTDGRWIVAGEVIEVPAAKGAAPAKGSGAASGGAGEHGRTVTVRPGDTFSHIAAREGVSVAALMRANPSVSPRRLWVGQAVTVPGGQARSEAFRPENVGDRKRDEQVEDTFLHYTYSSEVSRSAAANREYLAASPAPSTTEVRQLVTDTARRHNVDPSLMLAISLTESGWSQRAVSPANAIGVMQVIPTTGDWASGLVGRELNLLDPQDNVTAGTAVMRALLRAADSEEQAIAGYYQGLAGVRANGMYADTEQYVKTVQAVRTRF